MDGTLSMCKHIKDVLESPSFYRHVQRLCKKYSPRDAADGRDDTAQCIMKHLWKQAIKGKFSAESEDRARADLYTAANRKLIDRFRRRHPPPRSSFREEYVTEQTTPLDLLLNDETYLPVIDALKQLDGFTCRVFYYRNHMCYSQRRVAKVFGVSRQTIRKAEDRVRAAVKTVQKSAHE